MATFSDRAPHSAPGGGGYDQDTAVPTRRPLRL